MQSSLLLLHSQLGGHSCYSGYLKPNSPLMYISANTSLTEDNMEVVLIMYKVN